MAAPADAVYLLTGSDRPKVDRALARLRAHFDRDPATQPVVEQTFAPYERAKLRILNAHQVRPDPISPPAAAPAAPSARGCA